MLMQNLITSFPDTNQHKTGDILRPHTLVYNVNVSNKRIN